MSLANITLDDFDPPIVYANPGDWSTPNPQDNPTWFNQSSNVTGSMWHEATWHETTVNGAKVALNFTGTALQVWGASGPSYSNYTVVLDPSIAQPYTYTGSAYREQNGTERFMVYAIDGLSFAQHEVEITNTGSGMLLDLFVVQTPVGAYGATLTNTTLDENDSAITYNGSWTTNQDPNFYGGSSAYTNTPGDSLSFSFSGSAVYLFGDQVNDHGLYSVFINGSSTPAATLTGRSGCGARTDKYCEKLGGLEWIASGLPEGRHDVRVVNEGTTYFDIDYIVYTTPSVYPQAVVALGASPFANYNGSSSATGASGASGTASATAQPSSSSSSGGSSGGTSAAARSVKAAAWGLLGVLGLAALAAVW